MFNFWLSFRWRSLLAILILVFCLSSSQIFFPYLWGRMIEVVVRKQFYSFLNLFLINLALLVTSSLLNLLVSWLKGGLIEEQKYHLRERELASLIQGGMASFLSQSKGIYITRLTQNVERITQGTNAIIGIFRSIFVIVGYISPIFAPILLSLSLLHFFLPYLWRGRLRLWTREEVKLQETKDSLIHNLLRVYPVVAWYNKQAPFAKRILGVVSYKLREINKYLIKKESIRWVFLLFLFIFNNSIVIISASLAYYGSVPLLSFLTTEMYLGFIFSQSQVLQQHVTNFVAAKVVFALQEPEKERLKRVELGDFKCIKITNLSLSFREKVLFKGVNLEFQVGKKYAIIGQNGSGKSSLIRLILSWLKPTNGKVSFNGLDYSNLSWEGLNKRINFISDNFPILRGSVKDNLTLFNSFNLADGELEEALKRVNLTNFSLDMLIETESISKGERQRIALARILLLPKDILILDEALSNLDRDNRHKIEDVLLRDGKLTLIYITHTLDRPQIFDQVIDVGGLSCE